MKILSAIKSIYNINLLLIVFFCFGISINTYSQNIAINTTGELAHPSALIDISATNKGFLMPRVALTGLTDITTITSPDNALLIYNTATTATVWPGFYYWDNAFAMWIRVAAGYGGGFSWSINGNRGTSASANFVGTADDFDFYIRMNNINRLVLESNRLRFLNSGNSIFIGQSAGANDDLSDNYNIGIGYFALNAQTGAEYAIGIGNTALRNYSAAGGSSIGIGASSLLNLTSGLKNVAIGSGSMSSLTIGSNNVFTGQGSFTINSGNDNTGINSCAKTSDSRNTLIGGLINPQGDDNIGIGHQAFNSTNTRTRSIAIGFNVLRASSGSSDNIGIGYGALGGNNTNVQNNNVSVGAESGWNSTRTGGVHLGYQAGFTPAGNNLLYVENNQLSNATPLIYGDFTNRRLGINRVPTANNLEVGGTASKASAGAWLANSDSRIKTNITDIDNALETIKKLRPVTFRYTDEWKERTPYLKQHDHIYYNYIAQEYKKVFPESVKGSGEYLANDKKEILQIDTYNAQIVLVKAIQEQQIILEQLQKEIEQYQKMKLENKKIANALEKRLNEIEKIRINISKMNNAITAQATK